MTLTRSIIALSFTLAAIAGAGLSASAASILVMTQNGAWCEAWRDGARLDGPNQASPNTAAGISFSDGSGGDVTIICTKPGVGSGSTVVKYEDQVVFHQYADGKRVGRDAVSVSKAYPQRVVLEKLMPK